MNGVSGRSSTHAKGLGQGDLISRLLFVIALDVLMWIINKVATEGVISLFPGIAAMQRLLIYADDVALFIRPSARDLQFVRRALHIFGQVSG